MAKTGPIFQLSAIIPKLTPLFFNCYIAFVLRLYIGGIFIYASLSKINYPAEFADSIASYMLAPYWLVNPMAVIMPWLELICGALLILGIRARAAIITITGMMTVFSLAIAINLLRDTPIGCGCFHALEEPMSWATLFRDIAWIGLCIYIYFFDSWLQLDIALFKCLKEVGK